MTRISLTLAAFIVAVPLATQADQPPRLDRIEDRIDRREDIVDRRVTTGPLDRIEDRIDRRESIRDRRGIEGPRVVSGFERRDLRRVWR